MYIILRGSLCASHYVTDVESLQAGGGVMSHVLSLWQWHGLCLIMVTCCWSGGTGWLRVVCLMMLYQVCLLQLTGSHPTIQTASLLCCQTWYGIILTNVYIYLLPCGVCVCARARPCVCECVCVCACVCVCLYISNVSCTVCLLTIIHYKVVCA